MFPFQEAHGNSRSRSHGKWEREKREKIHSCRTLVAGDSTGVRLIENKNVINDSISSDSIDSGSSSSDSTDGGSTSSSSGVSDSIMMTNNESTTIYDNENRTTNRKKRRVSVSVRHEPVLIGNI